MIKVNVSHIVEVHTMGYGNLKNTKIVMSNGHSFLLRRELPNVGFMEVEELLEEDDDEDDDFWAD